MNTSWAASSASLSFFRIDIARLKIFPWYWRSSSSTAKELPARSPASSSLSAPVGAGGLSCSRTTHVAARLPVEEKAPRAGRPCFIGSRKMGITFETGVAFSIRIRRPPFLFFWSGYVDDRGTLHSKSFRRLQLLAYVRNAHRV